jgi:hypothetical protein
VAREQPQLMDQEGFPTDVQERLGGIADGLAEPGAEAAGEDADRRKQVVSLGGGSDT